MKYLFFLLIFLFGACSIKNYEHTDTKIITIKSAQLRFSDIGYIRHTKDAIELELFVAGHAYQRIHINHLICVDEGCMRKSSFNAEYLFAKYPSTLLQNIILGREIYNGKNSVKKDDGFVQHIQNADVDIYYSVDSHQIYFKDRKNHILIKIKDIQ